MRTGMISRSCSRARYTLASVCASTPWLASTTSRHPSQAARLRLTCPPRPAPPPLPLHACRPATPRAHSADAAATGCGWDCLAQRTRRLSSRAARTRWLAAALRILWRARMQAVLRYSSPASQQARRERPGSHRGPRCAAASGGTAGGARLIAEVYVAGGVDEVQRVHLPVACPVPHARLVQLDGDAPLPLQVHAVQELRLYPTDEQLGSQAVIGTWQEPPRRCPRDHGKAVPRLGVPAMSVAAARVRAPST